MGSRAGGALVRLLVAFGCVFAWPGGAAQAAPTRADQVRPADARAEGSWTSDLAWREDNEEILFRFKDKRITESSGIAVSPTHKGIYYTHNDSDDGPQFFAVGPDGRTRATFRLAGAAARDWEGMAASVDRATGKGVLWFADIGDNLDGAWPDISVYKVIEPESMTNATLRATRYRFRYADGGRNAEGIMVHPGTGRLYIVSKEFSGSVYRAPARLRTDRVNILRRVGPAPIMATDAAYAPDGSSFVIRTYFSASVYSAPGKLIARVAMPALDQAESIAYTPDGLYLLTGSEGSDSPVYRVALPEDVLSHTASAGTSTGEGTGEGAREGAGEPGEHGGSASPAATTEATRPAGASGTSAAAEEESDEGVPLNMILLWLAFAAGATAIITLIARTAR
ncbi:hypothetical protein AB0K60_35215 [Thermopolyspora sp. NPDC052614]|uniref:hypothetical protein n=1 Tax=Thermopolyspora sp. NPDC052614 TaxID=3155682 RepID=UPI003446577C